VDAGPSPGLLLRRYRVEGVLGEGGLGTVYRAADTRLPRRVAIKVIKRSLVGDPDLFRAIDERFSREADAGTRTGGHPNLVTVHDLVAGDDPERTRYLIQEFVPGGTLADRLKQGPLPLADALRLAADAARGLGAAHAHGIVHRDIKPSNIFLAADGRAQVGDFGIAQVEALSGRTSATAGHPGTPLYMSPEQAGTTGYVRAESDQYSLGLVLFEMLTGAPYKKLRTRDATERLARMRPPVRALVERMMADDPEDRYDSMAAVGAAIAAIERTLAREEDGAPAPIVAPPIGGERTVTATHPGPPRTPLLHLQTAMVATDQPPSADPDHAPSAPGMRRVLGRRAVLIGAGTLVLGGVGTAGAFWGTRRHAGVAPATAPAATAPMSTVAAVASLPPATSTPPVATVSAATVASTVAPTMIPTAIPTATAAATAIPRPTVAPTAVSLATWKEPGGLVQLRHPADWAESVDTSKDPDNVLTLKGAGITVSVSVFTPTVGIDADIQGYIDGLNKDQAFTRTFDSPGAARVGGEPARYLRYTYVEKAKPGNSGVDTTWYVDHAGKRFAFEADDDLNAHNAEIVALINSVTFAAVQLSAWKDSGGLVQLRHPAPWVESVDTSSNPDNALTLKADGINIHVSIFKPNVAIDAEIDHFRASYQASTTLDFTFDAPRDARVGSQAGKSLGYRYVGKGSPGQSPVIGTVWYVDRNGKRFEFDCEDLDAHRSEIIAMIDSVTFLK